jgi:TonB family protein
MGMSKPAWGVPVWRVRCANDRFKQRWGAWVARSTLAAVAAHVVVIVGWPTWELSREVRTQRAEMIQIRPVPVYEPLEETGIGAMGDYAEVERTELALENEAEGGLEVETGDVTESARGLVPSIAYPVMATASTTSAPESLRRGHMVLERMAVTRAALAPTGPAVTWPLIRNPSAILRFLKARYNPVHTNSSSNRFVSVAMGINERGTVEWTEVRESSGHPIVDEIALRVFNEIVQFAPARSEGAAIPVAVVISIPFDMPW